jgi:hypothetical protein
MENRCKICGMPVNHIKICNHCQLVREERRFLKTLAREDLRENQSTHQNPKSS